MARPTRSAAATTSHFRSRMCTPGPRLTERWLAGPGCGNWSRRQAAAAEHLAQVLAGVAALRLRDLLRRAGGDDLAALVAALGAHVDDPVGALDDVEIVPDDQHRAAPVDQPR